MTGARSALIVATYVYDDQRLARLRAPERDAEALAEVLADPGIGGFDVTTVINRPWHEVSRAVALFFRDRRPEDLVLLHFSCHGLKDDSGELYFAATDTSLDLLEATAVSSASVSRAMDRSRAGRVLLLLDCCYSGAFARGMTAKAAGAVDVNERLGGRGRAVITASSALQFAFEGDAMADGDVGAVSPSLFTSAVVRGLRSGDADRDLDGWVSLDEFYNYVHDEVTRVNPDQTPHKWAFDIAGDVQVARRSTPVTTPADLPPPVVESLASLYSWERAGAVEPLLELLRGGHPGRALGARQALERLAGDDDSDRVRTAAREALATTPATPHPEPAPRPTPPAPPPTPPTPPTPRRDPPPPPPAGPRGRRRTAAVVVTMAALVAAVGLGSWILMRGGADDASTAADDGPAPDTQVVTRLPETALVLTQHSDGPQQLVWLDVTGEGSTVPLVDEEIASRPTVNPARTEIAYLRLSDANRGTPYVIEADGSGDRPLLSQEARTSCPASARPAWSPDRPQLAMVCYSGQTPQGLWVADDEGRRVQELSGTETATGAPTWGTEGRLYFLSDSGGGVDEVLTTTVSAPDADGTVESTAVRAVPGTSGSGTVGTPDWGPQGLLYLRSPEAGVSGDVYLTVDGDTHRLTTSGDVQSPAWNVDGTAVAWLAPPVEGSPVDAIWTARLVTTSGTPHLGTAHRVPMSGTPGPLAWGSR